jgi:hypothetical protein
MRGLPDAAYATELPVCCGNENRRSMVHHIGCGSCARFKFRKRMMKLSQLPVEDSASQRCQSKASCSEPTESAVLDCCFRRIFSSTDSIAVDNLFSVDATAVLRRSQIEGT